jgi:hypothetical protein
MGKLAVSSSFRISRDASYHNCTILQDAMDGWDPLMPTVLVVYDGLWGLTRGLSACVVSDQVNSVMATKGWVCRVAEKANDWLGSSSGPHI